MTPTDTKQFTLTARAILEHFQSTAQRPLPADALADALGVPAEARDQLQSLLDELSSQGLLVKTRKGAYGLPDKMNLVVGTMSSHADGYGFVEREDDTGEPDIFVPGRKLGSAMHGDRVVARVEHVRKSGKPEGKVIRILDRARKTVVGRFQRSKNFGFVVPLDERMVHDVYIPEGEVREVRQGQIVYAEITEYPEGSRNPEGRIREILGDPDDPRIDVEIVIREYELPHRFPDDVERQAQEISEEISAEEVERRTDFRELPIVTIDGENAQDFDDAIHVDKLDNGNYRLAVHIADVAAYVPVDSAIDREALRRATSVYFPERVVPMLPEKLSNEVCSLRPKVDRLVQSVIMEIDDEGRTVNYELHDGVIRSAERMTYTEIAAILENGDSETTEKYRDHVAHFRLMEELCGVLREHRSQRGSIDFDLPEPEILLDMRGEVESIFKRERNIAHRLIEEFMIRANEVVASHLTWEDFPCIYRVHEGPDPEKVENFRNFSEGLGCTLGGGDEPSPRDYQRLIRQLEGTPAERVISTLMLRTMSQARYRTDNAGHFGLASERYCHFTSPIRRYPDLLVHRLMKAERKSPCMPELDLESLVGRLDQMALISSKRERLAEEAERELLDWKMVKFMSDKVGEEFEGFVTGVQSFGFFVELAPFFVEGLVHVSSLTDDYYKFDARHHRLVGESKGTTFTLGDRVKVNVAKVDVERRRLDFALVEGPLEPVVESGTGKKAEAGTAKKAEAKAAQEAGGKAAGKAEDKKKGRRRGRRGGRRRGGGKPKERAAKGDGKKDETKGEGGKPRRRRRKPRGAKPSKDAESQKDAKSSSDKEGKQPEKAAKGSRRGRRGGRGRGGRDGGDQRQRADSAGGRSADGAAGSGKGDSDQKAGKAKEAETVPKADDKSQRRNPYLTDLDF